MVPTNDSIDVILRKLVGDKLYTFMTGVLLVDGRTVDANEYVLRYISDFHRESGQYIDFYLPGYIAEEEVDKYVGSFTNDYPISIDGKRYYFQPNLYEIARDEYKFKWNIEKSRYPMLILMDVENVGGRYSVKQHLGISLKNYMQNSSTTVEDLFYKIFDYARLNTGMGRLNYRFRFKVLLGNHIPQITRYLLESGVSALLGLATNGMIG